MKLKSTKLNGILPFSFTHDAVVKGIDSPDIGQDSEADGLCAQ